MFELPASSGVPEEFVKLPLRVIVAGVTSVPVEIVRSPPIVVAPVMVKVPEPVFVRPPPDPTVPAMLTAFPFVSIVPTPE
jgi:hypothetical protein